MPVLHRLAISLPPDHDTHEADLLDAMLAVNVSHGWEEHSLPTGEARRIVHSPSATAMDELEALVRETLPRALFEREETEEQNWVEAWKAFFTPVEAGSRFIVLAPWMREERAATGRTPVIIEPKTAFGTGHHATTSLCLTALSDMADEGVLRPGMRFLDIGCGSGILGIAAARLGLAGDGLDIEIAAVENSEENRRINGIPEADFRIFHGSLDGTPDAPLLPGTAHGPYDIVVANILAGPLRELAPLICALPGRGDRKPILLLSGILDIQADAVAGAYAALGHGEPRRFAQGEWVALLFT